MESVELPIDPLKGLFFHFFCKDITVPMLESPIGHTITTFGPSSTIPSLAARSINDYIPAHHI